MSPFPYGHLKVVNYRDRDGRPGTAVTCTAPWKFDEVLPSYEHITPEAFKTTPYRTSTGTKIVPHLAPPNMAYAKNLVVGLMSVGLSEDASFEELRTWPGTELLGMPTMLGEPTLPWDEFEAATRALSIEDCAPSGDAHIVEL